MEHFQRSAFASFLLWAVITTATAQECYGEQPFAIKATVGGLTIQAQENEVVVAYFQGGEIQQWTFECGSFPGQFYIVNGYFTGYVLGVSGSSGYVTLNERDGSVYQQWTINSNGTILNIGRGENLEVLGANFVPGNTLYTYSDNGSQNQVWTLHRIY